jgi:hypothetical protein
MEEKDGKKSSHDWLKEHDFIQSELLKMKDELLKDSRKINEGSGERKNQDNEDSVEIWETEERSAPIPLGPVPESLDNEKKSEDEEDKDEEAISSDSPSGPSDSRQPKEEDERDGPSRLPEGRIPAAPDLTNKIANVLQLENKLKRRKFEIEKNIREFRSEREGTKKKSADREISPERSEIKRTVEKRSWTENEVRKAPKPPSLPSSPSSVNDRNSFKKNSDDEKEDFMHGDEDQSDKNDLRPTGGSDGVRKVIRRRVVMKKRE